MLKEKIFQFGLESKPYPEVKEVIKTLSSKFKNNVRCTDIVADEDAPEESRDKFIMKATFLVENANQVVDIYYGDESRIVTKVEWR